MSRRQVLALTVAALALWQVTIALLGGAGLLPGLDMAVISDRYDSWVVPAGYAFSIWGLIYLSSLILGVYQALPSHRDEPALIGLRSPLAVAFALNGTWILLFMNERFVAAQAVIILLTGALALAYLRLAREGRPTSRRQRWIVYTPVGLYLGWATVATAAGLTTTLLAVGVTELWLATAVWAVLVLLAAGTVTSLVTLWGPPEPGFPLAVIWAFLAIAVGQGPARASVALTALLLAGATLLAFGWRERRWHTRGGALASPTVPDAAPAASR